MTEGKIWKIRAVLKEFTAGSHTVPQVGARDGFCNGIAIDKLGSAAWKIVEIARLDPINAQHERIRIPVPYVR
jgi:hypothetical protein